MQKHPKNLDFRHWPCFNIQICIVLPSPFFQGFNQFAIHLNLPIVRVNISRVPAWHSPLPFYPLLSAPQLSPLVPARSQPAYGCHHIETPESLDVHWSCKCHTHETRSFSIWHWVIVLIASPTNTDYTYSFAETRGKKNMIMTTCFLSMGQTAHNSPAFPGF